jgi:sarcosine oxidase/N-methyl-L-tryptophan oxidase
VQRNVQAWFTPRMPEYDAGRFPAFLVDRKEFPAAIYGFPDFGDGIKAAFHGAGDLIDAEHCDREIDHERDIAPLAELLEGWMPGAIGPLREAKTCMYSLTPDEHFVIDRHPEQANLILCGGFSGHGFMLGPMTGELMAQKILGLPLSMPIDQLHLNRFAKGQLILEPSVV